MQPTTEYEVNIREWYVYHGRAFYSTGPHVQGQEAKQDECNYMQLAAVLIPPLGMNENKSSTSNAISFY